MQKKTTSWGKVSDWYHEHLSSGNTYHEQVILPNLKRLLNLQKGERVLDVACGEGFFTRALKDTGADIAGADISPELIEIAQNLSPDTRFVVAPIENLSFAKTASCDKAFSVLALQNIEHLEHGMREVHRILKPGGTFIFVINHPCFRIPKRSSWGFDEPTQTQYRRLDGYLTESKDGIDMHPGESAKGEKRVLTYSFHHPLQVYMKLLGNTGFVLTRLEEWSSHKKSKAGGRASAEDHARKEFPLFLSAVAQKT
ncbi:MAG TPA: class I SAM-dependent methyltransferase [Candidatus Paceibacterota bacterium]